MTATGWLQTLHRKAGLRERAGLGRTVRPRSPDEDVTDLAGNDYLGLSRHPAVRAAAQRALDEYGLGATGSRLVRGSTRVHAELEAGLAALLGTEAALVYSSGYLANLGAVRALATPNTLLVADAVNHASLVDGCRSAGAEVAMAAHADPAAVRAALAGRGTRRAVVVTESVFSVDGDAAPLAELHALCRRYDALLLVDDAHGVGVLGPAGAGGVAAAGLAGEPDVVVTATLSKAFGAAGGVVAGPAAFIAHLVGTGRTFIYDTALPPPVTAGALAALDLVKAADGAREELRARAGWIAAHPRLSPVATPAGGIVSLLAPDPAGAVAWAAACRAAGVAVGCFRPPSTPDGRSRLRLTVNTGVPAAGFAAALDTIAACHPGPAPSRPGAAPPADTATP